MLKTELWQEPRERILPKLTLPKDEPEMSEFESGFLCGLLRERNPRNVVEVGIAGGGTTAILLQALSELGGEGTLTSLDLSERFYRDDTRESGYLGEEAAKLLPGMEKRFRRLLGKVLPERLEELRGENGIDFLILDTVHSLPGELLDFLAAFPYLAPDAVVVLHDVAANLYSQWIKYGYATKILYDSVAADKYYMPDTMTPGRSSDLPNIAAFRVNGDTGRYIHNSFSALSITWAYDPGDGQLDSYRRCYAAHYSEECLWLFDAAVRANRAALARYRSVKGRIRGAARGLLRGT